MAVSFFEKISVVSWSSSVPLNQRLVQKNEHGCPSTAYQKRCPARLPFLEEKVDNIFSPRTRGGGEKMSQKNVAHLFCEKR